MSDRLEIALEVLHVHRVEAHDRRIQPDVGFRELGAEEIRAGAAAQHGLDAVEPREEREDVRFVHVLRGCEARFVYAVVDGALLVCWLAS